MARRPITPEIYAALVAAYRDSPGNHRLAASQAGVFWRTAKKGWEEGWPATLWAAKPIREVIAEEHAMARQTMVERDKAKDEALKRDLEEASRRAVELSIQPQAERDRVKQDAIEARAEEGTAVRLARSNAIGLLRTMGELVPAIKQLVVKTAAQMHLAVDMTPGSLVRLLREFAAAAKAVSEATEMALKMERLVLGEPTEILGLMAIDMSTDEAVREIMNAQEALFRVHETHELLPAADQELMDSETTDTTLSTPSESEPDDDDPLDHEPAPEEPIEEDFG